MTVLDKVNTVRKTELGNMVGSALGSSDLAKAIRSGLLRRDLSELSTTCGEGNCVSICGTLFQAEAQQEQDSEVRTNVKNCGDRRLRML